MKIILSLDGGGIRGVVQATILDYLEKKIQEKQGDNRIKLGNLIDFVSGTSTGSIVGSLLILPDPKSKKRALYHTDEIVKMYVDMGPGVFKATFWHKIKTLWGLIGPKYPASNIEAPMLRMMDHIKMQDLVQACLFTGYDIDKRRINIYTNKDPNQKYGSYYVKDIVRGSTSIPAFFPPAYFHVGTDVNTIVDGGVFANNPAMVSYVEVSKTVFGPKDGPKDKAPKDLLIISMGSGRSNRKKFPYNKSKRFGMINWVLPVLDVILSGASDVVDTEMWNLFKIAKKPGNYKRINPPLHYSVKPNTDASPENITNLIKDAGAYIEQNREFLDDLANRIVEINGLIKV